MENNSKPYDDTIRQRQKKIREGLLAILRKMPIIEIAVKKAGISRDTYYRWRKEDKEFFEESEDAVSEGIEYINDMSESQLVTLIKEKKMPAIALWLRHNNPRYMKHSDTQRENTGPATIILD